MFPPEDSMRKLDSLFTKCSTIFVFALLFGASAFGQNLRQDLQKSFKKFNITRLDAAQMRGEGVDSSFNIQTTENNFVLDLTPRDLRAWNYRAETTTAEGRKPLASPPVETFRGRIAGEPDSEVRLTVKGATVEGYFATRAQRFFIEPARRYSEFAAESDLVVYREEDFINPEGFACASELGEKIERGKAMIASREAAAAPGAIRVIEIATEADFEFVNLMGGANQANAEILSILNMVEGVYESQLGLTFDIVYQHVWTTSDGYNGANSSTLMDSFRGYWNANRTNVSRDVAHLWTAKPNVLAQGLAYLNAICRLPQFAYGLSGRVEWAPAKFDVTAHEIGHNLNASHAEEPQGCGNTIMNSVLYADTPLTFCSFSRTEITNFVAANGSCLSERASGAARFDFDNDRKADTVVFRPSNGTWYMVKSGSGAFEGFQFGQSGDKPVPADYDGDGKADAAVFRDGVWYRLKSSTSTFDGVSFGANGDVPAPADFDGDGKTDVAVFRPSNGYWFILNSGSGAFVAVQFGASGDVPMPADFDGDGKGDITVFRPSNGAWYRSNSSNNSFFGTQFGMIGDKPVSGDFDGDAKADIAVFRPSNGYWFILRSNGGALSAVPFGIATDLPVPADFNGDGKTDLGVFRDGIWHRFSLADSAYSAVQFGAPGDVPAPAFYVP
jgi:hypothetical protein